MVSSGKVSFSAKCLFGRIGGLKNFWEKKIGCRIRNFSHFLCQKTTFFSIFGPPLFSGRRPENFFRHFTKIFAPEKKFRFGPPPISTDLKIPSLLKSDATLIRVSLLLGEKMTLDKKANFHFPLVSDGYLNLELLVQKVSIGPVEHLCSYFCAILRQSKKGGQLLWVPMRESDSDGHFNFSINDKWAEKGPAQHPICPTTKQVSTGSDWAANIPKVHHLYTAYICERGYKRRSITASRWATRGALPLVTDHSSVRIPVPLSQCSYFQHFQKNTVAPIRCQKNPKPSLLFGCLSC